MRRTCLQLQNCFSATRIYAHLSLPRACGAMHGAAGAYRQYRMLKSPRHLFVLSPLTAGTTVRCVAHAVSAANFEQEVIESQQAICLVYYIPSGKCNAYLRSAESIVNEINKLTGGEKEAADDAASSPPSAGGQLEMESRAAKPQTSDDAELAIEIDVDATSAAKPREAKPTKSSAWLKLCAINADENRNLASAFSVERAKLPVTYFIMQGTIVDKVVGPVSATRLDGILHKFLEHYQKELNVDLLGRKNQESKQSPGSSSPIPSAATADLIGGASTHFLQQSLLTSLVGADMVQLPDESSQLDGLRKTLQAAKRKAYDELQDLHRQLGMDMRRLSDAELHERYYNSSQFVAMGVLSALECLYLARVYASIGDIDRRNVEYARRDVQQHFGPIVAHATMRRVLALVDVNLLKSDLKLAASRAALAQSRLTATSTEDEKVSNTAPLSVLRQTRDALAELQRFSEQALRIIDEHIDTRVLEAAFPAALADQLLQDMKSTRQRLTEHKKKVAQSPGNVSTPSNAAGSTDGDALEPAGIYAATTAERAKLTQSLLMCLLQLYPTDSASIATRSRLTSLLY